MAKALTASGIQITTETLRSYFFELKTAEQLRAENAEHERAMAKIRKDNDVQQRAKDLQHARELAQAGKELASSAREARVDAANQVAAQAVEAARRRPIGAASAAGTRKQPARDASPVHSKAQPGQMTSARAQAGDAAHDAPNVGNVGAGHAVQIHAPEAAPAPAAAPVARVTVQGGTDGVGASVAELGGSSAGQLDGSQAGQAKTIDEIARASQGQKETAYSENLVLKDGNTVWYESGKAFDGFLSPRTLHTLRNVGRVIAPTEGRTAKDFVPMSHEL
jgi:hypothetical protein